MTSNLRPVQRIIWFALTVAGILIILSELVQAGARNMITLYRIEGLAESTHSESVTHLEELSRYYVAYAPDEPYGYRMLGYALVEQGRVEEAIQHWCNVEFMSLELFHMGQQARRSGQYADAARWYQIVDAMKPGQLAEFSQQWPLYQYKFLEEGIPSVETLMQESIITDNPIQLSCQ